MRFLSDSRGAEIPEWAGVVALLVVVLVLGVKPFRERLISFFQTLPGLMGI